MITVLTAIAQSTPEIGDEVGALVDAFNEMAAELQESREVITRSTADLRRSNRLLDERRRAMETEPPIIT